jgi:hypothetical protein
MALIRGIADEGRDGDYPYTNRDRRKEFAPHDSG